MNRTVFTEAYFHEKKEDRNLASDTVLHHLRMRKLQKKITLGILGSTALLLICGMLLLALPA